MHLSPEDFHIWFSKNNIEKPVKNDCICQFAEDTGSLAISGRPCKGNKIICHHPENDGMNTYAKFCNQENCKYYLNLK